MPETGLKRSPKIQKGALVQLVKDLVNATGFGFRLCTSYKNYARSSWLFDKPGLYEVFVEGIRHADPKSLHHNERDAVGERIIFVLILLKIKPTLVEKAFINVNHVHGRAAEKSATDLDGLGVVSAAIEKRDHLVEYIGCRDQVRQGLNGLPPVLQGSCMVLIVSELKRKQITGIDEDRRHCEVR